MSDGLGSIRKTFTLTVPVKEENGQEIVRSLRVVATAWCILPSGALVFQDETGTNVRAYAPAAWREVGGS